jgi:Protein of unknown function (DUF1573)
MKYKLFYIAILLLTTMLACKNEVVVENTTNGLLPVTTINNPRNATGNDADLKNLGTLTFADSLHDFGTLQQGDIVEYDFEYINTGKSDVLINDAKSTCGCTVPEYTKEPIKPGEKGVMKVKFNSAGKYGEVFKPITITNNGNPGEIVLHIQAMLKNQ